MTVTNEPVTNDSVTNDSVTNDSNDSVTNDSGAPDADTTTDTGDTPAAAAGKEAGRQSISEKVGNRSVSLKTLLTALAALLVAVVIGILVWQWQSSASEVDELRDAAANQAKAEKIALDYATGAAQMSYQDADGWRTRLTKGTTPELSDRLRKASESMQQLIGPLQWTSTSKPLAATVQSDAGGKYQVMAFVDVTTKNAQAPDGIESTATYQVTIDPAQNWAITEISGVGSNIGSGDSPAPAPAPAPKPGN